MTRKLSSARGALALAAIIVLLGACSRKHDAAGDARDSLSKGDYEAAIIQLKLATQADPQSAELRVLQADALEHRHDLAGAQASLVKAVELGADTDVLAPRIALMMLDRNELDALVRTYQGMQLADKSADASLRGTVALALMGLEREAPAVAQLERAQAPAASVTLARAQLMAREGKAREALDSLDLDGAGKDAPWWVLRAAKRIAVVAKDDARALVLMKRAVDVAPWHGGVVGEYGEMLVTAGRGDEAVAIRDQLRKRYPGLFWTQYLDALLEHRAGRFEQAHAAALRALRGAPEHVPSLLMAASAELQKGDLLMAEKRLQVLLRKHPGSVPGWQLQAQLMARSGRKADLAAALKRGLELAPDDAQLLSLQADDQSASGQFAAAATTLTKMLSKRPNEADLMLRLANARFQAGDKAGAQALIEQAAAAGAADPQFTGRAVAMALRLNNTTQARRLADQAVAKRPKDPYAQLSLAAVQSSQNDRAGAWTTTLAVLDQDPTNAAALNALTGMSRKPEQHQELLSRHQAAVDGGTKQVQTYLDYASLLRLMPTQKASPLAVLEKGVQTLPTSLPLREALVEHLMRTGDAERAISTAQSGATMSNAPPAAAALLAATYERLGKSQPAAEAWRKLVNENPQRADWRLRLAQLDAGLGRESDAVALLRAAINERPDDVQPYVMLAQLQSRSNTAAALEVAKQLGEQPGRKGAGLLLAGDVLAAAGRNDDALAQFALASKSGGDINATLRTVQLLDNTGRGEAASQELEAALRKNPADGSLLGKAAQRAQARGDHARAVDLLQGLASKSPNSPIVLNELAWAQVLAGRAEALTNARRAASLMPDNPVVLHTLGMALSKAGKTDEAILALRAASNLAPLAAMPRLNLAQQLSASGDKVGAASTLRTIDAEKLSVADKESLGKLKAELGLS